jgi:hypothetical protein
MNKFALWLMWIIILMWTIIDIILVAFNQYKFDPRVEMYYQNILLVIIILKLYDK